MASDDTREKLLPAKAAIQPDLHDDASEFYSRVAEQIEIPPEKLTLEDKTWIYRARRAAQASYERHGKPTPSPSASLVYSVAWLLTQSDLYQQQGREGDEG